MLDMLAAMAYTMLTMFMIEALVLSLLGTVRLCQVIVNLISE